MVREPRSTTHPIRAWLLLPVLLLVAAVGGCNSPPQDSRVAIRYLGDGRAEVLALVCQGHEVNRISVFEDRSEGGGKRWAVGPPLTGEPRQAEQTQLLRVMLFDVPDGWETQDRSLTRLAPNMTYGLSFSSVEGQRSEIGFKLADLERLGDRVRTGPWMDEQIMSESAFVKAARADCAKGRNPGDVRG